jgi:BRCA1-associated protein
MFSLKIEQCSVEQSTVEPQRLGCQTTEELSFSAGNPRVEHVTGTVHLYREMDDSCSGNGHSEECMGGQTSCQLCVMSTPPDMGFAEFCTFLGGYFDKVNEIRLVRRDGVVGASHLVLLQFESQTSATGFYREYNGRPFCLLEPDLVCHLLYVKNVQYYEHESSHGNDPPQNAAELPSCPVCLERLDGTVSGIVTTVCNHRFHNQCLRQWVDSSCPVCRYCQNPSEAAHSCSTCRSSVDLWMCLICGHIGCGRYRGSHAANHFDSTGHGYALELESQRIWDYAQDAYVHRLVCNKVSEDARGEAKHRDVYQEDDAIVKSKVDAIAQEFTHLMRSQLESQRAYFENIVESHHKETEAILESTRASWACSKAGAEAADKAAQRAESKMRVVQSKNHELASKLEKSLKEQEFLRELNETLLANQKAFSVKAKAAEASEKEMKSEIADLKDQVRDLMMFIEARDAIEKSGDEAAGGTLLPVNRPKARRHAKR